MWVKSYHLKADQGRQLKEPVLQAIKVANQKALANLQIEEAQALREPARQGKYVRLHSVLQFCFLVGFINENLASDNAPKVGIWKSVQFKGVHFYFKFLIQFIDLMRGTITLEWLIDTSNYVLQDEMEKLVDLFLYGASTLED